MDALVGLIITLAAAGGLAGAALLTMGLRGQRIDDHPVCRGCRFDLVGVFPGIDVCPECGRGLNVVAVWIGRRRRRRGMILCGAVLLVVVLGGGGLVGAQTARGFNWNTIKPTRVLVWEVGWTGADEAAAELLRRHRAGELASGLLRRAVEPILRRQADPARSWTPNLGDLLVTAWQAGEASDEQALRYAQHALRVDLRASSAGGATTLAATGSAPRGGMTGLGVSVSVLWVRVMVDEKPIEPFPGLGIGLGLQCGVSATATTGLARRNGVLTAVVDVTAVGVPGDGRAKVKLGTWQIERTVEGP